MLKKTLFTIFSFIIMASIVTAQVNVTTYGVSPREAVSDSTDIFDIAYNGLANVGINTKVYLKGSADTLLVNAAWSLIMSPSGSAAALDTPTNMDETSEVTSFAPDLNGTYKIEFTNGVDADTVTINAGTYLGVKAGTLNCNTCHSGVVQKWEGTNHSNIFNRAMDGTLSDHYAPYCVPCHTTGYDANADNDGFDDRDWVYPSGPDSLNAGTWDLLLANSPEAMKLANIQCEACHGPGSEHNAVTEDNKMVSSIDVKNCSICHDSGDHHAIPAQWAASGRDATEFNGLGFEGGHAAGEFVSYAGGRGACAPCHSGLGYIQWVKEGKPTDDNGLPTGTEELPEAVNISCAVCHDPHDNTQPYQLRLSDTQLGDGTPITLDMYGTGAQCMECHRSRRVAVTYSIDPNNASSHYGPHHGPQADMLLGANYPDFGYPLPSSAHSRIENACVSCHMAGDHMVDEEGNVILVGGHSFNMNDEYGVDHVESCEPCHGDVGESFSEKMFFMNGMADHDGDGVEEGLQEEVHGMLETLATYLPQTDGHVDLSDKSNSPMVMQAGYAYMSVEEDRSFGIHNPAFTVALLKAATEMMKYGTDIAGAIQSVTDVPMDQGFQVRLVWTKFGPDDGVATDQVKSYTILRQINNPAPPENISKYSNIDEISSSIVKGDQIMLDGHIWDVVMEVSAVQFAEYAAVVPTLYNDVESTFKVLGKTESGIVAETEPMSGMSVDNIAPAVPGNVAASAVDMGIELSWDESLDKDFNYFEVYRSETQGFTPSNDNMVGQTVEALFLDQNVVSSTDYYYIIAALDISGNVSEYSVEVKAVLTGVDSESGIPTEYALRQNYPNPFNPSTSIKFAIPTQSDVKLTIFDITGKEIAELVNKSMAAGYYTVNWNASNISSGIYFYKVEAEDFVNVKKMILLK